MLIKTVPKDNIINAASEGRRVVNNFLLHGLLVKNDSAQSIRLKEISFELYASGRMIKLIMYSGVSLDNSIRNFAAKSSWLGRGYGAQLFLGEEDFYHPEFYASTADLEPGQETGIFNEYFVIVDDLRLDELRIKVTYLQEGQLNHQEHTLLLVEYTNRNGYTFPMRGSLATCGTYNALVDHRQHYSMEFAIDMAQLNEDQKLAYKEVMKNEDYVAFGKEVLAIGDGEVVASYSSFSRVSSWDWEERLPLIEQYGILPTQCGNHVVLKHPGGEYSFYGHLDTDSLTVKTGDFVKQGQVIGRVGHNGLSNCPHLHFQLMDGPDFMTARGLPCSFTNISDISGNRITLIQEDNILVHTD